MDGRVAEENIKGPGAPEERGGCSGAERRPGGAGNSQGKMRSVSYILIHLPFISIRLNL